MSTVTRREVIWLGTGAVLFLLAPRLASASAPLPAVMAYRNPGCSCCEQWALAMQKAGFTVTMNDDPGIEERRAQLGTPSHLAGCHFALIDGYVIEGHVPPGDVLAFLDKKPAARGLSVPGMPVGSPGMEMGEDKEPYDVLIFTADGKTDIFARH